MGCEWSLRKSLVSSELGENARKPEIPQQVIVELHRLCAPPELQLEKLDPVFHSRDSRRSFVVMASFSRAIGTEAESAIHLPFTGFV